MGLLAETVHEVSIWATLAITMAGLEDGVSLYDHKIELTEAIAGLEENVSVFARPDYDLDEIDPGIHQLLFEDSTGQILPLQVMCTDDGYVVVARTEDLERPDFDLVGRPMSELEAFVDDLKAVLLECVRKPTMH